MTVTEKGIVPVSLNLQKAVLVDIHMQLTIEYNEPKTADDHRLMYRQVEMFSRYLKDGERLTHPSYGDLIFQVTEISRCYNPPKLTVKFRQVEL